MLKIKTTEKVALVLLITVILTNPLTGQFVLEGLDWGFRQIFMRGSYLNLVASAGLIVYVLSKTLRPEKINIPKGKTKTQKYIENL